MCMESRSAGLAHVFRIQNKKNDPGKYNLHKNSNLQPTDSDNSGFCGVWFAENTVISFKIRMIENSIVYIYCIDYLNNLFSYNLCT